MMNNRLTNDAKAVLQYAQDAAQRFHHDYVGTEHILLGLVLNTDGIAGLLLNQLGLTPENVTRAIEQHVGWGQDTPSKLRLTPRTKRAMELAAKRTGWNRIMSAQNTCWQVSLKKGAVWPSRSWKTWISTRTSSPSA